MALTNFKFLLGFLILIAPTVAQAKCFGTVHEIKANHVKTKWQETTENDGKPLMISITDGAHGLVYSARKAGALWLTGNVSVCHIRRRYRDYLEKHPRHEQCPDGGKAGVAFHAVGPHCQ